MKKICIYLAITSILLHVGLNSMFAEEKKPSGQPSFAFVTYIDNEYQEYASEMLVNSIHKWGGEYSDCPIYVVLTSPKATGFRLKDKNVEFVSLPISESIRNYPFAVKAFAAGKVEEMTSGKIGTLAWFDPETMLFNPPRELDLKEGVAVAVSPVHFINTGQSENEPVDSYWASIYEKCGLDQKKLFIVETLVDCRKVRTWLNCGMFSVHPERSLLREWAKILNNLLIDKEYQRTIIKDRIHTVFLHQAVISTLIVSRLDRSEIHMLPSDYNYPVFCHSIPFSPLSGGTFTIAPHKKAVKLNDLTSVFIERLFIDHPDWIEYIPPVDEPLKTWLIGQYLNYANSVKK